MVKGTRHFTPYVGTGRQHLLGFRNALLDYTPCRADGLDANLTHLNPVDYASGLHKGLVTPCDWPDCQDCRSRELRLYPQECQ